MRIEARVDEGTIQGRLFVPDGGGPFPLVVQYMDAGGLRPAMDTMAEPLVAAGYAVVQPNLYWRAGAFVPFDVATVWTDPQERARLAALMGGFTPAQAMADTRALIAVAADDTRVRADRVGCVGYCMGGRMTLFAAAELADIVVAAASIHGGNLATGAPTSPHLGAPRIRGRMYFAVADNDASCTEDDRRRLADTLQKAGVPHEIELYPGALHGFAMPDFPVYDAAAAARQWARVLRLFREELP